MFNNNNIINSTKTSKINAKDIILEEEKDISENRELKKSFTFKIIIVAICLLIYWIILMLIYEKDKKYILDSVNDEELFNKYNPMIAGCIQGSRQILARDIIAVILNLINKKIIKLEIIPTTSKIDPYLYMVSVTGDTIKNMDYIEKTVCDWLFDINNRVDLKRRLDQMPREKDANKNFKKLNKAVEEELAKKGANEAKVPLIIRAFNVFLFILSVVLVFKHIAFNGFSISNFSISDISNLLGNGLIFLGLYGLMFIPVIMGLIQVILNIIIMIRHKVNKTVQKVTGQKVVTTTISIVVLFGILIILTAIFAPAKFLVADEILLCIATILVLTDNLMLKNDAIMIEDYSKLNTLKKKIEDYTLLKERDIEYIELWEKYLSYAVSFGISDKIINCMQGLNIDDDLEKLVSSDFMSEYLTTNYYYFYNNASLDRIFMKRYGEVTSRMTSGFVSSSGGGGGFSGGGSSSSGGGGCGGGRRSILKYLFKELDKK